MADHPRLDRGRLLFAALLAPWLGGCASDSQTLLLDRICRAQYSCGSGQGPACSVSGDARQTTGMTADSIGYHFGPKSGALHILLDAIPAAHSATWSLEVLAASSRPEGSTLYRQLTWGSCGEVCLTDPADVEAPLVNDYAVVRVLTDAAGDTSSGYDDTTIPQDAVVTFRGADIDIADIATPGYEGNEYGYCSYYYGE